MITTTIKYLPRFFAAACVLFMCACMGEGSSSLINLDSIRQDSLRKDSLRIDSLRADSVAKIPPKLTDSSFIPKGYKIKDIAFGDLNLDPYMDAIVVLQRDDEDWMDERLRPAFILTGDSSGNFNVALRNNHLTPAKVAGQMYGEPYNGIEIDSGTFTVMHYGGSRFRWTYDYVFEYDAGKQTWFYTANYSSMGDMLGEMNELDSTGQCIPYERDTLILKRKVDIRKFDVTTAAIAELH